MTLVGWLENELDRFCWHSLLENIFHPLLHALFGRFGMRQDIELFPADGVKDEIGYLGGCESRLHQLAESL
jgi:hypothetical protein